jgi:hypothetical protein
LSYIALRVRILSYMYYTIYIWYIYDVYMLYITTCHRASSKTKLFYSKQAKTWVIMELMLSQGPSINSSSPALKWHEAHVEVHYVIEKLMVDEADNAHRWSNFSRNISRSLG